MRKPEAPADAHDRDHLALNVDDAFDGIRGSRQRRDFDHAQDAIHRLQMQCVGLPVNRQQDQSDQGCQVFHYEVPISVAGGMPMAAATAGMRSVVRLSLTIYVRAPAARARCT